MQTSNPIVSLGPDEKSEAEMMINLHGRNEVDAARRAFDGIT